jgi:hypothetical protein
MSTKRPKRRILRPYGKPTHFTEAEIKALVKKVIAERKAEEALKKRSAPDGSK